MAHMNPLDLWNYLIPDFEHGFLYWKHDPARTDHWNLKHAGKRAETAHAEGYSRIRMQGREFLAHRVLIAMKTGSWPADRVDHKDGRRTHNADQNLHVAVNNSLNNALHRDSQSGVTGVSWHPETSKWRARIHRDGTTHSLGLFDRKEDAEAARRQANAQFGFSERHGAAQ